MKVLPVSKSGKAALLFTVVGVSILVIFFIFMALGYVSFDEGHWWDLVVGIVAPLSVAVLITGVVAIRKDRTFLVYLSLLIGVLSVVFLLTHSLFISD